MNHSKELNSSQFSTKFLDTSTLRLVRCQQHHEEVYTNYCASSMCMKLLCPECIEVHTSDHRQTNTYADIQSLKCIKMKCKQKLQDLKSIFESLCEEADEIIQYLPPPCQQEGNAEADEDEEYQHVQKIKRCEDAVMDMIKGYFKSLKESYSQSTKKANFFSEKSQQLQKSLSGYLENIETKNAMLEGQQSLFEALKDIFGLDWSQKIQSIKEEIREGKQQQLKFLENEKMNIQVNESKMSSIKASLEKYICILPQKVNLDDFIDVDNSSEKLKLDQTESIDNYQEGQKSQKTMRSQNTNERKENQKPFQDFKIVEGKNRDRLLDFFDDQEGQYIQKNLSEDQILNEQFFDRKPVAQKDEYFKQLSQRNAQQQMNQIKIEDNDEPTELQSFPFHEDSMSNTESQYSFRAETSNQNNSNNNNQLQNPLRVDIDDYFLQDCQEKFLPYFSIDQKALFLLNLNNYKQVRSYYNIKQNICEGHKLIITPQGSLFALGGIDEEGRETNKVWQFDYQSGSFIEKAHMITHRSQFSVVCKDEFIYAIGGRNNGKVLSSCEKYEIAQNKWINISNLNVGVSSATVCSYQKQYLFKFGGLGNGNNSDSLSHSVSFQKYPQTIQPQLEQQQRQQKNYHFEQNTNNLINTQYNTNKTSNNSLQQNANQLKKSSIITNNNNYYQGSFNGSKSSPLNMSQNNELSKKNIIEQLSKTKNDFHSINLIEKYTISTNKWEIIQLNHSDLEGIHSLDCNKFIINFLVGALQISKNSLFIFGGQYQKNPSSLSFSLEVKSNYSSNEDSEPIYLLNNFDLKPLPTEGTFSGSPIIQGGRLFALQNIGDPSKQNSKHLLQFNGSEWSVDTIKFE